MLFVRRAKPSAPGSSGTGVIFCRETLEDLTYFFVVSFTLLARSASLVWRRATTHTFYSVDEISGRAFRVVRIFFCDLLGGFLDRRLSIFVFKINKSLDSLKVIPLKD